MFRIHIYENFSKDIDCLGISEEYIIYIKNAIVPICMKNKKFSKKLKIIQKF